ncbi:hypothetical protein RX914_11030 [Pseudomonas syringae pv. actinidiae]|nr:hypothetical protein [Pseudomonas syringae pv. actinidiae]MDU8258044.1 hypothetical protein [Pseudomonas syringae pv. actinidiae]MDU8261171.1 hypothetical protein [Pseudomonas syringae pv. actinidiae]MDU8295502.1 hypothetical protein [Pseudomonas syringae pv. actinidiae]MDU8311472.1 hypothetical protein [Pseudomonas syringae pv. actinidiae]
MKNTTKKTKPESYEAFLDEMNNLIELLDIAIKDNQIDAKLLYQLLGFEILRNEDSKIVLDKNDIDTFHSKHFKESVFHNCALTLAMNDNDIFKTFKATRANNRISLTIFENYDTQLKIFSGSYGEDGKSSKEWKLELDPKKALKNYSALKKSHNQEKMNNAEFFTVYSINHTQQAIYSFFNSDKSEIEYRCSTSTKL